MTDYPLLRFVARHGLALSLTCLLIVLIGGGWIAYALGSATVFIGVAGASVIVFVVLLALCEMVRVIVDTLLPR